MSETPKFQLGHAAFYPATGITPKHIREASNIPASPTIGPVVCVDGQCYGEESLRKLIATLATRDGELVRLGEQVKELVAAARNVEKEWLQVMLENAYEIRLRPLGDAIMALTTARHAATKQPQREGETL